MKNIILILFGIMAMISENTMAQAVSQNHKSLVVYYSRRGSNYRDGAIVDLKVGNTEVVARKITAITGADTFRIETVTPYPEDYMETTQVAKRELADNARPAITGKVENMSEYDTIYLGYPNWWGTMPMAVFTFLESYDLAGKTIVPFCTHEGSAMGCSESDIRKVCPKSVVLKGLAIRGSKVDNSDKAIMEWIENAQKR